MAAASAGDRDSTGAEPVAPSPSKEEAAELGPPAGGTEGVRFTTRGETVGSAIGVSIEGRIRRTTARGLQSTGFRNSRAFGRRNGDPSRARSWGHRLHSHRSSKSMFRLPARTRPDRRTKPRERFPGLLPWPTAATVFYGCRCLRRLSSTPSRTDGGTGLIGRRRRTPDTRPDLPEPRTRRAGR